MRIVAHVAICSRKLVTLEYSTYPFISVCSEENVSNFILHNGHTRAAGINGLAGQDSFLAQIQHS